MGPLPYPHRATFLASTLDVPAELAPLAPYLARLIAVVVFDHLVRHRIVTLGDHDDERLVDDHGRLLDARHPQVEDSIDWFFRVSRRHEVLWFELAPAGALALHARRPDDDPDALAPPWTAPPGEVSTQLSATLAQWLAARRLPAVDPLPAFAFADLRIAADQLRAADRRLLDGVELAEITRTLTQLPRLAVPFLRVLAELSRDGARSLDARILAIDPQHPVARRNHYVTSLVAGSVERRAILPLVDEAPMYAKPHLSIWGEAFADERPLENMGVRHQGIAASLMPANPYACHNYALQLAEVGRLEESYRWADRATVAAPQFGVAHLDAVRRLRQVRRPGQAFAEAQYRSRELVDRAAAGGLSAADALAPHHAALLVAFTHLDVGRLAEAIELAEAALAALPADAATREAFAWADKRLAHWRTDAKLLARAYAWEGHHRGDPGRVLAGLTRGRIADEDDAAMLIEALVSVGRPAHAELAFWQCAGLDGSGVLGDGKARLAAAKALILTGDCDRALDQIQIVQLRRGQSRFEAEINRLLRLAAIRPAADWQRAIERRLQRGALTLAERAARDLADFVPGLGGAAVAQALGARATLAIDPVWIAELIAAVPAAQATSSTILSRLARPADESLEAADALAQEWWTVLVPPARDRDAHAAGAVLALGLAIANYLVLAAGPPSPLAGAYRHIATEALHLVRRSRYQIEAEAVAALLRMVDWLGGAPEWLLDTWLLRIERALDLEAEHGAYLAGMCEGMPTVQRLLRGDERIGWELRLAHDLAADPSQYEPAAALFARCARVVEGGAVPQAWCYAAAAAGAAPEVQLDLHWLAAYANPSGVGAPWLRLAHRLFAAGRKADGFEAACRGVRATPTKDRAAALAALQHRWHGAALATPFDAAAAYEAGLTAAEDGALELAVQHLQWAAALEPANARRAHSLAVALARSGAAREAVCVLASHERADAPRLVGRVLLEAGRMEAAVACLHYASRRFRAADDWAVLCTAASRIGDDVVAVEAGRRALALGAKEVGVIAALATSLYRTGDFAECERVARALVAGGGGGGARGAGLHAMARALAGQGRFDEAAPFAREAGTSGISERLAAELSETLAGIAAREAPPVRPSVEISPERLACADLEAGQFASLSAAVGSPSWGVARVALIACEFRTADESGVPVSSRAIDGAISVLGRSEGSRDPDAVLARIRALRIRDNAFIQIDPPPPMGARMSPEEFERAFVDRDRRPHRPSALQSFGA